MPTEGKSRVWRAIIVIVVLAVVWGIYSYVIPPSWFSWLSGSYQAVFLSNGQVYFGKLFRESNQFAVLREVYYLQISQAPQPLREGETPPSNINLVKLGGELHGPADEMRINRDQILFIEDLKADSRVLQAITQLKKGTPQ